jgi:signal transduction histidine kinase
MGILRNIKIKYKILLVVLTLLLLVVDLGILNVSSVRDIQSDAQVISEQTIPRLLVTSTVKDNLNSAVLAVYDYILTGNENSKQQNEDFLKEALNGQLQLFSLAETEEEFLFSQSFKEQTNELDVAIADLITAYENGASPEELEAQIDAVSSARAAYSLFLTDEIELAAAQQAFEQTARTDQLIGYTVRIVIIVVSIAVIICFAMYVYMNKSITQPIEELTAAASDITKGQFRFVDVESTDELGLFADTFNTMAQRIKATQESLEIELKKTKQLDTQKTEFLSIAAHQLRTPMSGIKWVVNMAVSGDLGDVSDEAKEHLGKGLQNIDRMIVLINNLLDVTQIEAQKFTYQFKPINIVELLEQVVHDAGQSAQAKDITIEVKDVEQIQSTPMIDADKMQIAFRNVVDNAIKYTPEGGLLTISCDENDDSVLIAFKDDGYGIPKAELPRIFTKFYRGSNIQSIQADGSGLGLFLVHEVVENHGGHIQIDSIENEGTTFTFSLPIKQA